MKVFKYIAIAAASVLALSACEREYTKTMIAEESAFVAPQVMSMADVVIDANNNKVESVTFVWTPADMGVSAQIEYSLYLQAAGATALVGQTYGTSLSIAKNDLNSLVLSELGLARNATTPVSAYVLASLAASQKDLRSSNTVDFKITTFDPPKDWVFFPGFYNDWGNSNDKEEWRVWEVEGGKQVYRTIVELSEDATNTPGICPLKLYMDGSWLGGSDGYVATWDNWDYGDKDGNWGVPASEPINIIEFSKAKKSASRKFIKCVGLIGSFAPSGWNTDVHFVFDHSKNVWETPAVELSDSDEFLVRLSEDWSYKYGGGTQKSDAIEGGVELENDGNAANIKSPGAGTYIMKLYANRTPVVLVMEKQ